MKIESITLHNFRNYADESILMGDGINIFYGENAQGKTNILEAVYLFSSAKSHRGAKDKELIRFSSPEAQISMKFYSQQRSQEAKMYFYQNKNKQLFINEIEQKKIKALLGIFSTVIFSPEDLELIKDGPEARRRFLDTDISQLRPNYYKILKDYGRVLEMRNNLLKKEKIDKDLLEVYSMKLAKYGAKIMIHRQLFIDKMKQKAKEIYFFISDKKEELSISYRPSIDKTYELKEKEIVPKLYEALSSGEDILRRSTLKGPHRDEVIFLIDGKDAKSYCSQGQQRSIVLSLKLAEFVFMEEVLGESPVLLLDDILSELDAKRREKLISFIKDNQTIITCTDKDFYYHLDKPFIARKIQNGRVMGK